MIQKLQFRPVIYGAEQRQTTHTHDELHLSIVVRGVIRETVGSKSVTMGPLTVMSKDPGLEHADEYGPAGATMAQLSLPATSLGMLTDGDSGVGEWHVSSRAGVARPYLRLMRRAAGAACEFDVNDADVIDLLAGLTASPRTAPRRPPAWLEQQIDRIRWAWSPGMTVVDRTQCRCASCVPRTRDAMVVRHQCLCIATGQSSPLGRRCPHQRARQPKRNRTGGGFCGPGSPLTELYVRARVAAKSTPAPPRCIKPCQIIAADERNGFADSRRKRAPGAY